MKDFKFSIEEAVKAQVVKEFADYAPDTKVVMTLDQLCKRDQNTIDRIIAAVAALWNQHTTPALSKDDKQGEWMTRAELKKYLNVGTTTVWRWEKAGILHPKSMCRKKLYLKSEVEKALTN